MQLTLLDTTCVVNDGSHSAFTSLTTWRGNWYLAHRTAATHAITPPGSLRVWKSVTSKQWIQHLVVAQPNMDLRDPKLIASPEALYMICGAYTPRFPSTELRPYATQNLIQSYITYTEDGEHWTPLAPLGRPGYWIWSVVAGRIGWIAAAYHTGTHQETSSIHLLSGTSLLELAPLAMIYDGSDLSREGGIYRHAHTSPSEPVLYQPSPETVACLVRTEKYLEIGVSRSPGQDWRWWTTYSQIHPSAMYDTGQGWLMAGRAIVDAGMIRKRQIYDTYTCLWPVNGQSIDQAGSLFCESAYDTGYAEICAGAKAGELLVSYYSQHETGTRFGTRLPGSGVYVARVSIEK